MMDDPLRHWKGMGKDEHGVKKKKKKKILWLSPVPSPSNQAWVEWPVFIAPKVSAKSFWVNFRGSPRPWTKWRLALSLASGGGARSPTILALSSNKTKGPSLFQLCSEPNRTGWNLYYDAEPRFTRKQEKSKTADVNTPEKSQNPNAIRRLPSQTVLKLLKLGLTFNKENKSK